MTGPREEFIQRVRDAVAEGNRAGAAAPLPERGSIGYQGAGDDAVQTFCDALTAAGGASHVVPDVRQATTKVLELVKGKSAGKILLGRGEFLDPLQLHSVLSAENLQVIEADKHTGDSRDVFFSADIGVSAADCLIAETGSAVVSSKPDDPRSVSLLPPVHIVVAAASQLLPDLFDFFTFMRQKGVDGMSSGMALITGPSKTGDIELKLVTGVHGPGEVHVVLYR